VALLVAGIWLVNSDFCVDVAETDKAAVALVSPGADAVMFAEPAAVGVKLDVATPLLAGTGEAGLNDPLTPLTEKLIEFVAVVTVFPLVSCTAAV
jgi:hypothetical protein